MPDYITVMQITCSLAVKPQFDYSQYF